jgi:hypothetical protein
VCCKLSKELSTPILARIILLFHSVSLAFFLSQHLN